MTSPGFDTRPAADALEEAERFIFALVVVSLFGAGLAIAAYLVWGLF